MGDLSVQLVSSLPDVTDGNPNYSLGGLKIGVYADAACTKELVSVPADAKVKDGWRNAGGVVNRWERDRAAATIPVLAADAPGGQA